MRGCARNFDRAPTCPDPTRREKSIGPTYRSGLFRHAFGKKHAVGVNRLVRPTLNALVPVIDRVSRNKMYDEIQNAKKDNPRAFS